MKTPRNEPITMFKKLFNFLSIAVPPFQIPILMSLLYHNDTIIKKEKELLRALLSQFCKLEFSYAPVLFYNHSVDNILHYL